MSSLSTVNYAVVVVVVEELDEVVELVELLDVVVVEVVVVVVDQMLLALKSRSSAVKYFRISG